MIPLGTSSICLPWTQDHSVKVLNTRDSWVQQLQIWTGCTAVVLPSSCWGTYVGGSRVACKFDVLRLVRIVLWLSALPPYASCKPHSNSGNNTLVFVTLQGAMLCTCCACLWPHTIHSTKLKVLESAWKIYQQTWGFRSGLPKAHGIVAGCFLPFTALRLRLRSCHVS